MTIGEKIKEIRIEKGLTQKTVGERCGVTDHVIRHYEKGLRNPKMNTLDKIASGLGVTFVELIRDTPYSSNYLDGTLHEPTFSNDQLKVINYATNELEELQEKIKGITTVLTNAGK